MTVDDPNPAQKVSASALQVFWSVELFGEASIQLLYTKSQMKFGMVLV